jgi:hypothetical protein
MTTAEEYRHIAEEFFRLAHEAKTEDERKRFFDMALSWSQAAAGEDGRLPQCQPRPMGYGLRMRRASHAPTQIHCIARHLRPR